VTGTEHNHVGHDERDGGGNVGAQEVGKMRQVRGAGGSGVRITYSSTNGEEWGKPQNGVKREDVATAAVRRKRGKRERCSGVRTCETMTERRAVHLRVGRRGEARPHLERKGSRLPGSTPSWRASPIGYTAGVLKYFNRSSPEAHLNSLKKRADRSISVLDYRDV